MLQLLKSNKYSIIMKKFNTVILTFIIIVITLSSCSTNHEVASGNFIMKRKYRKGYFVKSVPAFKKSPPASPLVGKQNEIVPVLEKKRVEDPAMTASVQDKMDLSNHDFTGEKYRAPSELSKSMNQVKELYRSDIADVKQFRIEYRKIKTEFQKNIFPEKNGDSTGGSMGLSIASFVLGLVGLLVAGIILGTMAIIFGAISLVKNKKGKALAIIGIVLGVIDVIGALIVISNM